MPDRYTVDQIAQVCHEANRALQAVQGDPGVPVAPPWDECKDQASSIAGVELALSGATPEELHEEWTAHKFREGWTWGPVKDEIARTHPCLVPYDELPAHQRDKDDLFSAVVSALGETEPPPAIDVPHRHPATRNLVRWLTTDRTRPPTPESLVERMVELLMESVVTTLPDGPELTDGLRHLLQAKDSFLRAVRSQET